MSDEQLIKQLWVCVGKGDVEGKKTAYLFQRTSTAATLELPRLAFVVKGRPIQVGHVYEVEATLDCSRARLSQAKYVEQFRDKDKVLQWQFEAEAYDIQKRLERRERVESARALAMEALDPIRRAYWSTDTRGRLAIEVQVLYYLRTGRNIYDNG